PIFLREALFQQEKEVTYRIPALLYLPSAATFLAFAEKRSTARDEDAKYLVLRRAHPMPDAPFPPHHQWELVEDLSSLVLPGHRTMNPCPLYDASSGTIFLFCICVKLGSSEQHQLWRGCSAARLCFSTSTDDGRSWNPLRDVTDEAIGKDLSRWATFAVGPGHGIQLASGRLVVPAYAYYIQKRIFGAVPVPCSARQRSLVFYSDDRGRSWRKGDLVAGEPTGECQVAEIFGADAHHSQRPILYLNARSPRGCRAVAISPDLGLRFGPSGRCPALGEPPRGCQGSVVGFTVPDGDSEAPTWLLYSHPVNRHRRSDLGVYLNPSPPDGEAWWHPWVLHPGPAGYSDLAACPRGVFGCLFECGATSPCEEIAFCIFSL
ncbi:NEUR3 protein, partial [Galbula dea]|nr:NEUR3 protein [Galbula dea]